MKEQYLNYKKEYNNYILLIKNGNFYISLNNDAYIMNKLFNYKILESTNIIKTGFPISNIDKIKNELINKEINYLVIDNDIIDNIIDSTNEEYVNKTIEKLKQKEIDKINNSNSLNKEKHINDINKIPYYIKGKGLPIGNMSSQVLAIMYLNELDHFIKEELKIKYYIRYMDDGIIIHENKEYLIHCLNEITKILDKYKLKLNNKTKIYSYKEEFEFLGFRYIIKNNKLIMKISNKTKKRFKRKIKNMNILLNNNKITELDYIQVKNSYLGHLSYGNTNKLVDKTLYKQNYIDVEEITIINNKIIKKICRIYY